MTKIKSEVRAKLINILLNEYEECQFFLASSNLLINKIQDISLMIQNEDPDFSTLRDTIGELGIFISNAEKRLEEVEDCYTKMVEALKK